MKKTILIVDDSKDIRELLIRLVEHYLSLSSIKNKVMPEVIEAEDGEKAWNILSRKKIVPDLIITDYQMPKMNGLELIKKIQDELRHLELKIILHSSYLPARYEAENLGCMFIFKAGGEKKIFNLMVNMDLFSA